MAPDLVLTAAHCTWNGYNDPNVEITTAKVGRWDKTDESESFSVTQHVMHSDYNPNTDQYDIALLKLSSASTLPIAKINNSPSTYSSGVMLTALGWGDLGDGTFPNLLQQVNVQYISNGQCSTFPDPQNTASYQGYIYNDMMCAFTQGKDGCYGDSGGPLLKMGSSASSDVVVGITSWGIGCARMPGVYARIDFVDNYNWIVSNICALSDDPPSVYQCPETDTGIDGSPAALRDDGNPNPPLSSPAPPRPTPGFSPPVPTPGFSTPAPTPGYSISLSLPPAYSVNVGLPPAFLPPSTPPPATTQDRSSLPPAYSVSFSLPPAFQPPSTSPPATTEDRSIDRQQEEDTHDDEREGMIWMEESTLSTSSSRRQSCSWTVTVLSIVVAVVARVAL